MGVGRCAVGGGIAAHASGLCSYLAYASAASTTEGYVPRYVPECTALYPVPFFVTPAYPATLLSERWSRSPSASVTRCSGAGIGGSMNAGAAVGISAGIGGAGIGGGAGGSGAGGAAPASGGDSTGHHHPGW